LKRLPLVIASSLRFSCHRCGECCRNFTVGLDDGEAERIAAHDWATEDRRFRKGFTVPGVDPWGESRDQLVRRADGRCTFLADDGACLIEARLGHEAKPRICRKFPYVFVRAPDGERACVSVECASRYRSLGDGEPLEAQRDELEALARASRPYRTRWRVQLAPGERFLTSEGYLDLERALRQELPVPRPLVEMLTGLARVVFHGERAEEVSNRSLDANALVREACKVIVDVATARGDRETATAARALAKERPRWNVGLAEVDADPEAAAFVRAVLGSWLDEAVPGQAVTAAHGVGQMFLGVLLIAALGPRLAAWANRSDPKPLQEHLNLAAREVSLLLRGRSGATLRELLKDTPARLCRALAQR
jgi:Fe-S-cluster containining protein